MLTIRRTAGKRREDECIENERIKNECMDRRIHRMERRQIALSILSAGLAVGLALASAKIFPNRVSAAESPSVLHLKGLVIEDGQGRARILLGAPFPAVPDRVRQDDTTTAMLFLDEQGHDRFSIGEKMTPQIDGAVPTNFHKPGTGYGLTLFDQLGDERGSMGFLSNGSTVSRAVFSLDRPKGDAIGAIVDDTSGYAGLVAMYPPRAIGVEATAILLGTQGNKGYLSMQDTRNLPSASLSVGPEPLPSLRVFDSTGKPGPNLLKAPVSDRANIQTQ